MLGGPLAGIAVKALSAKLLGRDDGTEAEVAAAVQALGPQDLIRLREIEADLVKTLADNEIKLESLATQDRDSARRRAIEMRDYTPNVLAFVVIGVFGWMLDRLMNGASLGADANVAFMMLGTLTTAVGQALNYFYGTSRSSADKSKVIANMKGAA
jgi:F0F1-type ATP synthase assembly protein I